MYYSSNKIPWILKLIVFIALVALPVTGLKLNSEEIKAPVSKDTTLLARHWGGGYHHGGYGGYYRHSYPYYRSYSYYPSSYYYNSYPYYYNYDYDYYPYYYYYPSYYYYPRSSGLYFQFRV